MARRPTVVSFFTDNPPYPQMAKRLETSCRQHGLEHVIEPLGPEPPGPPPPTWIQTVALKGEYCLQKAMELKRPILWVDADGEILRHPGLLYDCEDDFAVYAEPRPRKWRPVGRSMLELPAAWEGPPKWFLTGTLYFGYTPHALAFLEEWAKVASARSRDYQQLLLQEVWCRVKPSTLWLPQRYCWIKGKAWHPDQQGPPVIAHDLASVQQKGIKRK